MNDAAGEFQIVERLITIIWCLVLAFPSKQEQEIPDLSLCSERSTKGIIPDEKFLVRHRSEMIMHVAFQQTFRLSWQMAGCGLGEASGNTNERPQNRPSYVLGLLHLHLVEEVVPLFPKTLVEEFASVCDEKVCCTLPQIPHKLLLYRWRHRMDHITAAVSGMMRHR